jgi:hypothetical protein
MRKLRTPLDAATTVLQNPMLPVGDDERFVGCGVMGFPFASGHYLALRYFPATSFSPGYRSVWHRDPAGVWTFYSTTPGSYLLGVLLAGSGRAGFVRGVGNYRLCDGGAVAGVAWGEAGGWPGGGGDRDPVADHA